MRQIVKPLSNVFRRLARESARQVGKLGAIGKQQIAAQALTLGCTVVTDNTSEFSRVKGLRAENWLRAQ